VPSSGPGRSEPGCARHRRGTAAASPRPATERQPRSAGRLGREDPVLLSVIRSSSRGNFLWEPGPRGLRAPRSPPARNPLPAGHNPATFLCLGFCCTFCNCFVVRVTLQYYRSEYLNASRATFVSCRKHAGCGGDERGHAASGSGRRHLTQRSAPSRLSPRHGCSGRAHRARGNRSSPLR